MLLLFSPASSPHRENANYEKLPVQVSVWRAAGLTSEPAEEVVVVLRRQVGEDVLDPPPKLEAENDIGIVNETFII